jgi:hypothetical protein
MPASAYNDEGNSNAALLPLVIHHTIVPESSMEQLGLTNLAMIESKSPGLFDTDEVAGLPRAFSNVIVRTNVLAAGVGQGNVSGFTSFLARAQQTGGFEIASSNLLTLQNRSEGMVSLSSVFTLVANEISSPTVPGGSYPLTTNISLAATLRIYSAAPSSNGARLSLAGLVDEFRGYKENPAKKPQPVFDIYGWNAELTLAPGQVAVLSSGPYENVVKFRSSMPYVSSLPLLGKYFIDEGSQTNRFYRVYFVRCAE